MRVIAGRYRLEARLGSGGMGTVWKAADLQLQRTVAVKLLHEGLAADTAFAERFRREARAAAKLNHPNVVTAYDTGTDEGTPFIVMEYVEGSSLHQVLHEKGPLAVEEVARIARAVLSALDHAHARGLVHRDVKPANILQHHDSWKVADFGIAKGLDDTAGLTRSGLIGTAAYLSPEQVSGHQATAASDLYAVGCLLYASLVGEPPFSGGPPVAVAMMHLRDPVPPIRPRRPDVGPELEAVLARSLQKDPARRFASAAEMDAAIAATGLDRRPPSEVTLLAAPATIPQQGPAGTEVLPQAGPSGSRSNRVLAAVTAFLVVAAASAVLTLYLQNREPGILEAPFPTETADPGPAETPTPSPTPTEEPATTPRDPATPRPPLLDVPGILIPDQGPDPTTEPEPTPSPEDDD